MSDAAEKIEEPKETAFQELNRKYSRFCGQNGHARAEILRLQKEIDANDVEIEKLRKKLENIPREERK